jgi:hypothetical protein
LSGSLSCACCGTLAGLRFGASIALPMSHHPSSTGPASLLTDLSQRSYQM